MNKTIWKSTREWPCFLGNVLVGVRAVFLPDCLLVLSLLKYWGVGAFLNQKNEDPKHVNLTILSKTLFIKFYVAMEHWNSIGFLFVRYDHCEYFNSKPYPFHHLFLFVLLILELFGELISFYKGFGAVKCFWFEDEVEEKESIGSGHCFSFTKFKIVIRFLLIYINIYAFMINFVFCFLGNF